MIKLSKQAKTYIQFGIDYMDSPDDELVVSNNLRVGRMLERKGYAEQVPGTRQFVVKEQFKDQLIKAATQD